VLVSYLSRSQAKLELLELLDQQLYDLRIILGDSEFTPRNVIWSWRIAAITMFPVQHGM